MVDQNAAPPPPTKTEHATHTSPAANGLSSPSVVQAGEVMLIISLVLILLVVVSISVHFYLKRQKRRRPPIKRKDTKESEKSANKQPELQSQSKEFAELTGTPLCEMGDPEPRHEMEDAEVPEICTMAEPENPWDNPVHVSPVSPYDVDLEAGAMFGEMTTHTTTQPEPGVHAAYWAR